MPDAGVIGILIAHLGAFGSGELKRYIILFFITIHEKKQGVFTICLIISIVVRKNSNWGV